MFIIHGEFVRIVRVNGLGGSGGDRGVSEGQSVWYVDYFKSSLKVANSIAIWKMYDIQIP